MDNVTFRPTSRNDVKHIVAMLADDPLGATRERYEFRWPESHRKAFEVIGADPNNGLVMAESGNKVIGVLQLTFIPYLIDRGERRASIEERAFPRMPEARGSVGR